MADINHVLFAEAVKHTLQERGLTFGSAVEAWPELNKAMLSRVCAGKPLSAGNFLLLCALLQLRPYDFLVRDKGRRLTLRRIAKSLCDEPVTVHAKRETEGGAP